MSDTSPKNSPRNRLDTALVARELAETRAKAQGLILSGRVLIDGSVVAKCGAPVRPEQSVTVAPDPRPFVSRGGGKLEGALDDFGISCDGRTGLDVGASTGGFTDCLLRRGVLKVYAADVGENLMDDRLRRDPRVVVIERTNFRHAASDLLPEKVSIATVDVSFISLRHILPPLRLFLLPGAAVVALVKPQFEVGREWVGKGGIVRDEGKRQEAVSGIKSFAESLGFSVEKQAESRLAGPGRNREVFIYLRWGGSPPFSE